MPELRITTGIAKNRKLKGPKIEEFRAVQEKAKLAVFSILEDKVQGATCLDLYAGSGNMGLEAISRGASWCDFVDNNKSAFMTIKENIALCGFEDKSEFHFLDCVKYTANTTNTYDIIFADPFYKDTSHIYLLKNLEQILKDDGVLVFLHGGLDFEKLLKGNELKVTDTRRFGKSFVTFLKR